MTNKEVIEQGKIVQTYPIDHNPFTGEQESNGGIENLIVCENLVYSVLTDFTGSIADPDGEPTIITDDAESFMQQMFFFQDPEEVLESQTQDQEDRDAELWSLMEDYKRREDDYPEYDW